MAKMRKKADLPSKTCPVCQKPFAWRKKWEAGLGKRHLLLKTLPVTSQVNQAHRPNAL
jgi:hypothetical protein